MQDECPESDDGSARGEAAAVGDVERPFDLFDVYQAVLRRADRTMDALHRRGFEIALDKICSRITRDGASAVRFASARDVFAYAKRAVSSSVKDARRRATPKANAPTGARSSGAGPRRRGAAARPSPSSTRRAWRRRTHPARSRNARPTRRRA